MMLACSSVSNSHCKHVFAAFFDSHIYCHVLGCIQVFGGIYFAGDGICIAIVRLLYVKRGSWVRYTCGEFCLVNMVAGISILNAALMTYLHSHENISNRSVYNVCMGYSHNFQVTIFLVNSFKNINNTVSCYNCTSQKRILMLK